MNGSNLINRYNKATKAITKQIVAITKKKKEAEPPSTKEVTCLSCLVSCEDDQTQHSYLPLLPML